jgi:hypothetical protein
MQPDPEDMTTSEINERIADLYCERGDLEDALAEMTSEEADGALMRMAEIDDEITERKERT